MMKSLLVLAILLGFSLAHAGKAKPSEDEFVENRLQDCVMFQGESEETCERLLRKQFRKAPYLEPAEFVRRLMALKNLNKKISTIAKSDLPALTAKIRDLPIAFTEEMNGCDSRAETIAYALSKNEKIDVLNIYLSGHLVVESKHLPLDGALISWGHHVAPAILVKEANGKITPYSLDLNLLGEPKPLIEWLEAVTARSETLVEMHALPKFETAPIEAGEAPPKKFSDAQVSLIEERLSNPRIEILSKSSTLRTDLSRAFLDRLKSGPVTVANAYASEFETGGEIRGFAEAFGRATLEEIEKSSTSELRCQAQAAGGSICGVYFWTKAPTEYCQVGLTLAPGARVFSSDAAQSRVTCYRFSE